MTANLETKTKLLQDSRIQQFLSKLIQEDSVILRPVFDLQYGYRYPLVEEIIGERSQVDQFLNELVEAGVLKKEFYDKVLACQHCGSANVSIRYSCPYCASFNIKKSSLIEHVPCGYVDVEERFKKDSELECPRCGKKLNKQDPNYRKAGVWCSCNDCAKNFDIPVPSHHCRNCRRNFTFEDALYKDVYSYRLSENAIKEALGLNLVTATTQFLETNGFKIESPGRIQGKSGMLQAFDIIAHHGDADQNLIVIDLATSADDAVPEHHIAAMFAKVYDLSSSPCQPVLIVVPRLDEDGKRLANVYNIKVIEAKGREETLTALKALVNH